MRAYRQLWDGATVQIEQEEVLQGRHQGRHLAATRGPRLSQSASLRSTMHWNLERCYLLLVANVSPAQADKAHTFAGGQEVASQKIVSVRGRWQHCQDVVH